MVILLFLLALLLGGFGLGSMTSGSGTAEPIQSQIMAAVPGWAQKQGFAGNPQALAGARLFAASGCTNCHTYLGKGSRNLGAPDLSAEGTKGRSVVFLVSYLKCPSCVKPGSTMPSFGPLGPRNLRAVAAFLEASKRGA